MSFLPLALNSFFLLWKYCNQKVILFGHSGVTIIQIWKICSPKFQILKKIQGLKTQNDVYFRKIKCLCRSFLFLQVFFLQNVKCFLRYDQERFLNIFLKVTFNYLTKYYLEKWLKDIFTCKLFLNTVTCLLFLSTHCELGYVQSAYLWNCTFELTTLCLIQAS